MSFDPRQKIDALVWGKNLPASGTFGRWAAILLRYLYATLRDLFSGEITMRSMSLVYTTLLSVVPLIAFSFSVLKGFGVHEALEDQMYLVLEPLGEKGREITDNVMTLVRNVNGGVLGGISLAFFIYTAVSMVQKIEESFNFVWHVGASRSFARRFTEYMFVLLVGPVVIVIALGMLTSLQNDSFVQFLLNNEVVGPLFVATSKLTPYLLVSAVFTFLYAFIPNTQVKLKSALIGGLAGGFMWASIGLLMTAFVVNSARTQAVYAGFAIAVITLFWIYLNWIVLLLGAKIAFYVQNPAYLRLGREEPWLSNSTRERMALNVMLLVGSAFREPGQKINLESLSRKLRLPSLTLSPVIAKLEQGGLLTCNEDDDLLPGREMARTTLDDVLSVVRTTDESLVRVTPSWDTEVDALSKNIDMAIAKTVGTRTLSDLLDDMDERREQAAPES
ncbi:MAG: YihY/virulence factor BrkB family protein [Woeseiaceae bacterium]|nr:YihY/virulence factor BrkB family protein [Woeseiaceae bacterium]